MELKGTVQDIIYKNETNGYTIASFDMESAETTIVGYLPFVQKGDSLKVIGKFVVHPDYGDQFKVETNARNFGCTRKIFIKWNC